MRAFRIVMQWRLQSYARTVVHAAARQVKTLALIVGIFVFGLPLDAQLDLLSLPMKALLNSDANSWEVAVLLVSLTMLAAISAAVQGDSVFGGAARRWTMSLPGATAAHRAADLVVTGFALWPFWIMLLATIARHVLGANDCIDGDALGAVLLTIAIVWIGSPLALMAGSRSALCAIVAANAFLWLAIRYGACWSPSLLLAFVLGVFVLWHVRINIAERQIVRTAVLRRGTWFGLVRAVLLTAYVNPLKVGSLMLGTLSILCGWMVTYPDGLSRHWGIANAILPFTLYQVAIMHGWMRDEAKRLSGWFSSLPNGIKRFRQASAVSIVSVSIIYIAMLCLPFSFASGEGLRYAQVFCVYAALAILLAVCRWFGPRRSRIIDVAITSGCAITCYCLVG